MVRRSKLDFDEKLFDEREEPKRERSPFFVTGRQGRALIVVALLALALLVLLVLTAKNEKWWAIVLIGIIFFASEFFALAMKPVGRLSLALVPVMMAAMASGPLGAALVTLFGIPVFFMEQGTEGPRRIVYNACQMFFAAGAAAWVFHHVGGAILKANASNAGKLVVPWILATIIFYVFNTFAVTPVLAEYDEGMFRYWERRLLDKFPGYVLYSAIGFLAAIVYIRLEYAVAVILFAPLLGMRVAYTRYATMRDVCDETTLAIMEAVEGSPSTMFPEGHSVAVADMAVAIAEEMDFAEEDIHYLKQAALLHDIGKLALDQNLVDKPGSLTQEEFEEIKKHPLVGGSIVSKEPSFAVVAPTIIHHHEAIDGSGYVDGLAGDTIPMGARILGVADAFDAMQRPTTYREGLGGQQAASEVIRAKGIQFDPEVVDAFTKVVVKRGIWSGALTDEVRMPAGRGFEQPTLPVDMDQPTLEEAATEAREKSSTPSDGIAYTAVRDEIEKDMREWKRSEVERTGRKIRGGSRRRAGSLRKKKGAEGRPARRSEGDEEA